MPQNGNKQVREEVMAYARHKARDLSLQGLSAHEIVEHIDGGGLNETERDLLWQIASSEVSSAGSSPGTEVVSPHAPGATSSRT